jgi:hypothetical protein
MTPAAARPYMSDHYYLMYSVCIFDHPDLRRCPTDPEFDFLTGIRNGASTKLHWFSLLGGKAITAPCEERINDHYTVKVYNPTQEEQLEQRKIGIITGITGLVASILGLAIGRWWEHHVQRRKQKGAGWRKKKGDTSDARDSTRKRPRRWYVRDWEDEVSKEPWW